MVYLTMFSLIISTVIMCFVDRNFDSEGAEAVLASLRQIFAANSAFKFKPENIKIISGSEEGISGWIAVNYLAYNSTKVIHTHMIALEA